MKNQFFTVLLLIFLATAGLLGNPLVFSGGSGTSGDPYLISSISDLQYLAQNSSYWAAGIYFKQTTDIDASSTTSWNSGAGWVAIGNSSVKFSGSYDGQEYSISNLYINNSTNTFNGLFGYSNSATLSNIKLVDVDFSTSTGYLGGICCEFYGGTMSNCSATGVLMASGYCGGLCTDISSTATIENCSFVGNISASGLIVGGIVGQSGSSTDIIKECWSAGNIYGASTSSNYIGGIVAYNRATVHDCYSLAKVSKNGSSAYVGGVVGYAHNSTHPTVTNCYSAGPLKSAIGSGTVTGGTGIFWDKQTSGIT